MVQRCIIIRLYYFSLKQVNNGVYYTAVNDIYLYKVPITWISLYFLFTTIFESPVTGSYCFQVDLEIQNRENMISKVRTSTANDYHLASYQSLLNLTIKEIKFLPSAEVQGHVSIDKAQLFLMKPLKPASPTQYKGVFLFSAIGILSPVNNTLEGIALNLWEEQVYRDRKVFCCFLSQGGQIHKTPVARKSMFLNHSLTAVQVFCEAEKKAQLKINTRPVGVTLAYDIDICPMDIGNYATVQYTRPCLLDVCIAICAKIAYGYVNPEMVVEWMEYYKYMGVNHVIVFTFNLTADALTVLKFYEKQDFVEVLPFDFPAKGNSPCSTHLSRMKFPTVINWTSPFPF